MKLMKLGYIAGEGLDEIGASSTEKDLELETKFLIKPLSVHEKKRTLPLIILYQKMDKQHKMCPIL